MKMLFFLLLAAPARFLLQPQRGFRFSPFTDHFSLLMVTAHD
jgi:hypothetical protein